MTVTVSYVVYNNWGKFRSDIIDLDESDFTLVTMNPEGESVAVRDVINQARRRVATKIGEKERRNGRKFYVNQDRMVLEKISETPQSTPSANICTECGCDCGEEAHKCPSCGSPVERNVRFTDRLIDPH